MVKNNVSCKFCGKRFHATPSQIRNGRGKFCSRSCANKWRHKFVKPKRGKNTSNWQGGGISRTCPICGKELIIPKGRIKEGRGKFCSRKCYYISITGPNAPNWGGGPIKRICKMCGKEFLATSSRIKRGQAKFCSKKCTWEFNIGKNSSGWKGGITTLRGKIYNSDKYKQWRQDVFIKDDFTCQKCKQRGGKDLNAHHIKRFHILVQEAQKYLPLLDPFDTCMLYSPLWDVFNGIVLCKKCHELSHKKEKSRKWK